MALRWLEGFEGATIVETVHQRIYESAVGTVDNAEAGASESDGGAISSDDVILTTRPLVSPNQNSWIIGCAFRPDDFSSITGGSFPYVALNNDDGEQIRFEFVEDNDPNGKPGGFYYKIRAMRGATELASTTDKFQIGTEEGLWIYFEFKATIDNASGSFEGRFHWCQKPSSNPSGAYTTLSWDAATSSIDTQNQTSTGANRFVLSFTTGDTQDRVAFDDIYVCDSTGSKNNDYLGKVVIEAQNTSDPGDGDTTDWTLAGGANDTEDAINEPTTSIEDDKRLTSDAVNQVHLAAMESLSYIPSGANIIGVRQDIHCRMETTGDLDIAHMFRKTTGTPAQTDAGTPLNVDSTTYEADAAVLEDDPNTATDWDRADLDSYQHGVRNDG